MSDRVDDILDLIDAGLQSTTEAAYGTDFRPGQCARCQRNEPAEGGDLCPGCRAFLLGDSDDDPRWRWHDVTDRIVQFDESTPAADPQRHREHERRDDGLLDRVRCGDGAAEHGRRRCRPDDGR